MSGERVQHMCLPRGGQGSHYSCMPMEGAHHRCLPGEKACASQGREDSLGTCRPGCIVHCMLHPSRMCTLLPPPSPLSALIPSSSQAAPLWADTCRPRFRLNPPSSVPLRPPSSQAAPPWADTCRPRFRWCWGPSSGRRRPSSCPAACSAALAGQGKR